MVNSQLLNYIVAQEHAGFSEEQIQQALLHAGYSPEDINEAFRSLKNGSSDPEIHTYVEQYARSGYSASQIFVMLKEQGYPAPACRKAINHVFGKGAMASSDVPHTHIFLFSFLALVVGAGSMYFVVSGVDFGGSDNYIPPSSGGVITFSPTEIIQDVIETTRREGGDEGISQCESRLIGKDRDLCIQTVATTESVADPNLCSRITDTNVHDACYFNFLNSNFDLVCSKVKLAKTKSTCDSLTSLRAA